MSQLIRFLIVGLLATATHFAVVIGLVEGPGIGAMLANGGAWASALGISYVGHYRWTFTAGGTHMEHFPRYMLVSLTGLGLNLGTVLLLHHQLGAHYLVATTCGVTLSVIVTFVMSRLWAFSK